jgi:hypothetical protein
MLAMPTDPPSDLSGLGRFIARWLVPIDLLGHGIALVQEGGPQRWAASQHALGCVSGSSCGVLRHVTAIRSGDQPRRMGLASPDRRFGRCGVVPYTSCSRCQCHPPPGPPIASEHPDN